MPLSANLQERAAHSGLHWARALSADVLGDGRSLEGGFPGTLSEARICAQSGFAPEELVEPLGTEIVHAVYESARAHWNARCCAQLRAARDHEASR